MTLQQKKTRQFAEALKEFDEFKLNFYKLHPEATKEEYEKAIEKKAEELDL